MKKLLSVLVAVALMFALASCNGGFGENIMNNYETGGKVDYTDHNAPKEIKSKDLKSFDATFFRYGEYGMEYDSWYHFGISKNESGKYILTESRCHDVNCEVDKSVLDEIQKLIDKYELVKFNGRDEHTAGLPDEYQPAYTSALYESGEKLYFRFNNNPYDPWSAEVLSYLGDVFAEHGIMDYQPPEGTRDIVRFELDITEGNMKYRYGELSMPKENAPAKTIEQLAEGDFDEDDYFTVIEKSPWDRTGETDYDNIWKLPSKEYYEGLQKVIEEVQLKQFDNGYLFPFSFDYENTPNYYCFYVEYEYGNTIMGFSSEDLDFTNFSNAAAKLREYLDGYIEN